MNTLEKEKLKKLVRAVRKDIWWTCFSACLCALAADHIGTSIGKAIGAFIWRHF